MVGLWCLVSLFNVHTIRYIWGRLISKKYKIPTAVATGYLTETCGKILFFPFSDLKKQRHLTSCLFSQLNPHQAAILSISIRWALKFSKLTHLIAELCVTLLFIPCQGLHSICCYSEECRYLLSCQSSRRCEGVTRGHTARMLVHCCRKLPKGWITGLFQLCNRGKRALLPPCPEKCPWRYLSEP